MDKKCIVCEASVKTEDVVTGEEYMDPHADAVVEAYNLVHLKGYGPECFSDETGWAIVCKACVDKAVSSK